MFRKYLCNFYLNQKDPYITGYKNPGFEGRSWMKIWKPYKCFLSRKNVGEMSYTYINFEQLQI